MVQDSEKYPNLEGYYVVRDMWSRFWNPSKATFTAKQKCSGIWGDENKFNIWAMSVAAQAIVDGARVYPNELGPMIAPVINAMYKYRSPQYHGYCAVENFNGNKDIYYDDDAQVASALITAYEVTNNKEYLDSGRDLVRFLMGGFNNEQGGIGGMKWHISKDYINACTTAECAVAALRLARFIPSESNIYVPYAEKCLNFNIDVLLDKSDYLVRDGTQISDHGKEHINGMKWTYNTGTTLTGYSLLYTFTKNPQHKEIADKLADAALDRNRSLFDRDYPDKEKRYWRDPSYFVQLLIEGLADYDLVFGNSIPEDTKRRLYLEVKRHLKYFREYMKDEEDGLYWESFEIFKINKNVYTKYKEKFGGHKGYSPKGDERENNGEEDIDKRPMAKNLIATASAARINFQAARIIPNLEN